MLNNQSIFITGGTGTLGRAFIKNALTKYPDIKEITIYSRDEMKQYELRRLYPSSNFPIFRWVIGDIRDAERLNDKMKGADIVIHTAAMKHIPICEENPEECLKTNLQGTKNVIQAAIENDVKKTILASTDKAVDPISIYGNSKQAAEKLFLHAGNEVSKFAIVRLGNIWGSRGSVVPLFKELAKTGVIPITHPDMTRFFCTKEQSADSFYFALKEMKGGEIFIPRMEAKKITDIANEIAPSCKHKMIGLRGFEKIGEKLVSDIEINRLHESDDHWTISENQSKIPTSLRYQQLDSNSILDFQLN
ncbi:polysaccharide biosynthesis protein [Reichenbachiella sp.]